MSVYRGLGSCNSWPTDSTTAASMSVSGALDKQCSLPYLRGMTDATAALDQLDIRAKLAHIDQMLADHDRVRVDIDRILADRDRKRQEIRFAPWLAVMTGMGAGAALFAAGAAFIKLLGSG